MLYTITIMGCGVVGKATGKGLIKKGHNVKFVDKSLETVNLLSTQGFDAYSLEEYQKLKGGDITMICVSTPTLEEGKTDYSNIQSVSEDIGKWLANNNDSSNCHVVVVRSTVPPYCTRGMIIPIIEQFSQLRAGVDFGVCMQPEFLRAASSESDYLNQWFTVIGELDKKSGEKVYDIYSDFCKRVHRTDIETAEFMKYVHNCYNATKISFSNEMWMLGSKIGIDSNLALELAIQSAEGYWNPSYGTRGGRPYGGACLPKDTKSLISYSEMMGFHLTLLPAVDKVNTTVKKIVDSKVDDNGQSNMERLEDLSLISKC